MKFGLKQTTIDAINSVFNSFTEVDEAILYGSRAKGNYKNGSDIDITLKGKNMNINTLNKISLVIDDLLLPYTLDLSILKQIKNPDLIAHIERVGIVFYEKEKSKKN